jgi:hypothetical protein
MQHASFLYRQRTLRGLRSTIKITTTTASGKRTISSSKVIKNFFKLFFDI